MRTKTLDFLVIGSGRSGTTSLWKHLDSHPEIHTPVDKEQEFFSVDSRYERGIEPYMERTLGSAGEGAKRGTVTPAYMAGNEDHIRTIASRIKETAPDARLIALLRDPIDRAVATYRSWVFRKPVEREFMTFDELTLPSLRGEKPPGDIITGSEYGRMLSVYLEFFPRDQLYIAFTADLEREPEELMRKLFEFIGVDPGHRPPNLETRYRKGGTKAALSPESMERLIDYLKTEVWPSVEDPSGEKWRAFNWWLRYIWSIEPDDEGKEIEPTTRRLLIEHYAPDIEVLRDRIGVEPPWAEDYTGSTRALGDQTTVAAKPDNGRPAAPEARAGAAAKAAPAAKKLPLPTFLIIGAQKSSTRWLRRNLGDHPEIFTFDGECAYFNDDSRFERGPAWYRSLFDGWEGEEIVGEATPGYMMWTATPPKLKVRARRIDQQLPGVKLIAILRNPVDRLYSAFIHHMLHDRIAPDDDLLEVVARKPPKKAGPRLVMGGMYGESLKPFVQRFGDRLAVFLQEDAKNDAEALYRRALQHVGADPDFVPAELTKVIHSYKPPADSPYAMADGKRRPLTDEERNALYEYFEEDIDLLESLIDRDLGVWRP